jgi:hypothetical protein
MSMKNAAFASPWLWRYGTPGLGQGLEARPTSLALFGQYFVQETKRIREHQERVIAERINGAK